MMMTARQSPLLAGSKGGMFCTPLHTRAHGLAALVLAGLMLATGSAMAGPVPGGGAEQLLPVEFPTPESVTAAEIAGSGRYRVTFRWKPEAPVQNPAVAGAFNGWNRTAHPFEGPDDSGYLRATVTIEPGDYAYKFTASPNQWFSDPLNPDIEPDGHGGANSILRLGPTAMFRDTPRVMGDGRIEWRAVRHDPAQAMYLDVRSEHRAAIRLKTLRDDVTSVSLVLIDRSGGEHPVAMPRLASEDLFDFHEALIDLRTLADSPPIVGYTFALDDGAGSAGRHSHTWPLVMDTTVSRRPPRWASEVVWYQIMVDRFRDGDPTNNPEFLVGTGRYPHTSDWLAEPTAIQPFERDGDKGLFAADGNGDQMPDIWQRLYGGDFAGLIEKLDYVQQLGVTGIYLNPVFEATSHHKYNGKSYIHMDDGYGVPGSFAASTAKEDLLDPSTWEMNPSDEKFLKFLAEAKKRGLRVVLDGVFNHLGDDAPVFIDLKENGPNSRYADWFEVRSWEPFVWAGWAGYDTLPAFAKKGEDLASPSLRQHIFDATRRWMDPNGDGDPSDGIDGWRLDVPFEIGMDFWRDWSAHVKAINPNAVIIGEVWEPAESWLDGRSFDSVMNYQLRQAMIYYFVDRQQRITTSEFANRLARLRMRYHQSTTHVLQNLLDSHDTDRITSRVMNPDLPGDHYHDAGNSLADPNTRYIATPPTEEALRRLRLMELFLYTYPGAPMLYYGTEVGMFGADDPFCRNPMWWPDLGPWTPPHGAIREDLLAFFRGLNRMRAGNAVLSHGDYEQLLVDDQREVLAYRRVLEGAPVYTIVLNNGDAAASVELPWSGEAPALLAGEGTIAPPAADRLTVKLAPVSGVVLRHDPMP
jgi:glycosidase